MITQEQAQDAAGKLAALVAMAPDVTAELFTPEARLRLFRDATKSATGLLELLGKFADLARPVLERDYPKNVEDLFRDGHSTPVMELLFELEAIGCLTDGEAGPKLREAASRLRRAAEVTQEDLDREHQERPTLAERRAEVERALAEW